MALFIELFKNACKGSSPVVPEIPINTRELEFDEMCISKKTKDGSLPAVDFSDIFSAMVRNQGQQHRIDNLNRTAFASFCYRKCDSPFSIQTGNYSRFFVGIANLCNVADADFAATGNLSYYHILDLVD